MVVVTNNILVTHPQLEETLPEVESVVSSQPEEPVSSEVVERSSKRTNEQIEYLYSVSISKDHSQLLTLISLRQFALITN